MPTSYQIVAPALAKGEERLAYFASRRYESDRHCLQQACSRGDEALVKRAFQALVKNYYERQGRDFPWRHQLRPYRVLVSEFMLQQTQTDRVVPKFLAFCKRFPSFRSLSQARTAEVLVLWQGLGYNRRAIALHRAAQQVVSEYAGRLPCEVTRLELLPGVGPYTARAVLTFAFNQPQVVIETNIRTVFLHHFFDGKTEVHDSSLLPLIEMTLDAHCPREWYWALMDYGAALKRTFPGVGRNSRHYVRQSRFEGSRRQVRGAIIRGLSDGSARGVRSIARYCKCSVSEVRPLLNELEREDMIERSGVHWQLRDVRSSAATVASCMEKRQLHGTR